MYLGALEDPESCEEWKAEYGLPFPVVADADGELFRRLTTGWVPWSILVEPDGVVAFSENEFDEAGLSAAISELFAGKRTSSSSQSSPERAARTAYPGRSGPTTTLVLGGGIGGLVAARKLRSKLGREHRVVVVDRSPDHLFQSSLLWLMDGTRRPDRIRRPLARLTRYGIEFLNEEVVEIDVERRRVATTASSLSFDYLVVALGARTAPESLEGFSEMAHDLYSVDGCLAIRAALEGFPGGRVGVLVTSMPFKCPAAPYEAAFLIEARLRRRGVRDRSEIHLYTPEHQPMPVAGASLGASLERMLRARGIHYHPLFTFEGMRPSTREIVTAEGAAERVDLLIAVPPHQAPDVVRDAGLAGVSGWIHVDSGTLRTEHEGVFAIGDVAAVRLPSGKALPKAGVFAHHEAEVVAREIAAEVRGAPAPDPFDGRGACWIEMGDGRAGFASGSFFEEPEPRMRMARPGRIRHWTKVAFEQWWLWRWL